MDRGYGLDGGGHEREPDLRQGIDREADCERRQKHRIGRKTGKDRDGKSSACSAGRGRGDAKFADEDDGFDRVPGRGDSPGRDADHEKAAEPKQKTPDLDMIL